MTTRQELFEELKKSIKQGEKILKGKHANPIHHEQLKHDLLAKLLAAQKQKSEGCKGRTLRQVMANITETINANGRNKLK